VVMGAPCVFDDVPLAVSGEVSGAHALADSIYTFDLPVALMTRRSDLLFFAELRGNWRSRGARPAPKASVFIGFLIRSACAPA
jgi:hypothetical protein